MTDKSKEKDDIWHFFTRDKIKQTAQCNKCKKVLKSYGGSTSSLHAHLKSAHQICALKRTAKDANLSEPGPSFCSLAQQPSSTIPQITDFFQNKTDDSLAAIVSRMTAKDGLPLSIFCTSSDLRKLLFAKGFQQIPKSANTIRQMISGYAEKIQIQIKREISDYKENGGKCSLTLDEWTSTRNRRYLNINVHSDYPGKFWNLGLVRIIGSLPAEKCIGLINEKLKIYNISFENDVVAITTDGAAVMKKVGNLIPASQQLCFAHAIQLAVLSVLYRKKMPVVQVELLQLSNIEEFDSSDDHDTDADYNEDEEDFEFSIAPDNVEKPIAISHEHLMPLIAKIRKVIKLFRLSQFRHSIFEQRIYPAYRNHFCIDAN